MYTLLKNKEAKKITLTEIPSLFAALIITEAIYHFGSFVLEMAAFLGTWFAISFIIKKIFPASPGRGS